MIINKYSEFQPLREVVVGQGYPPEYFDNIEDPEIRDNIQKIFFEIDEDFTYLVKTLESFGVTVKRPGVISKQQYQQQLSLGHAPQPPLTPRDRQGTFGKKLVNLCNWPGYTSMISEYKLLDPSNVIDPFETTDNPVINGANNSCVFQMGRDIWFDESEFLTAEHSRWLEENVLTDSRYRFHRMLTEGHGDCVFGVLKPGVIITSYHDDGVNYTQDFPGWSKHHVDSPSITRELQQNYWQFRDEFHPGGLWWTPGKDNAPKFSAYVDKYLHDWIGSVHESVFDVNCLSIDEKHVIFGCYDKGVFDYCESHGVTPILCDIRHRFFFDGSVHCCTLDIRRDGDMEDYYG